MNDLRIVARWTTMLVTAATWLCGIAAADTIVATGVDSSAGEYNVWIGENGQDVSAYFAGVILIQLTDSAGVFNRDTLCVQLFTDIYLNQTYGTTVVTPDEVGGGTLDRVSWLVDNALPPIMAAPNAPASPAQGAGLQLAVWDIREDNGDGFSSGTVQQGSAAHPTDPSVLYWANYYESLSAGKTSVDAFVYVNVSLSDGSPAQMLEGPEFPNDGGPQPQPEPATPSASKLR